MSLKIAAITFGCKVNQYETACILADFRQKGYLTGKFDNNADIYLINTCTVTGRTDHKSRNAIRKALAFKKKDPRKKVVVTGCYAQRERDRILRMGPVDLIIDNGKKNQIAQAVRGGDPGFSEISSYREYCEHSTDIIPDRTRAFIKIQDGCDFFCSYCAVPYGRGRSRSRKQADVIRQVKTLAGNGYREFVLGGVNLGLYGHDRNSPDALPELLTELEKIENVRIIRLSSFEPQLFSERLLAVISSGSKIAPHFHLAVQHGSDHVLKKMNRNYTAARAKDLIRKIHAKIPSAALGLDIIAGLPGETERYFSQSLQFLQNCDFTYLHVFSYSKRPGTEAARMKEQVAGEVIRKRSRILLDMSKSKKLAYSKKLIRDRTRIAGIIEKKTDNLWTALSDHYLRIYLDSGESDLRGMYSDFIPLKLFKDGILVEQ